MRPPLPMDKMWQALANKLTIHATRQSCVVSIARMVSASMVINVNLLMGLEISKMSIDTPNTKLTFARHFTPKAFVLMDHAVISYTI